MHGILRLALTAVTCVGCISDDVPIRGSSAFSQIASGPVALLDSVPFVKLGRDHVAFHLVSDGKFMPDGRVAIAHGSSQSVLMFDTSGVLVQELGRSGEGPGEFKGINTIHPLGRDTLAIWDIMLRRITVFPGPGAPITVDLGTAPDPSGLRASAPYAPYRMHAVSRDQILVVHLNEVGDARKHEREKLFAALSTWDGEYTAHVGRFFGTEWYHGVPLPLGPRGYVAASQGVVYIGDGVLPRVSVYDTSAQAEIGLELPVSAKSLSDGEWSHVLDAFLSGVNPSVRRSVEQILADAPRPERAPSYTALRSTSDGRLWFRMYRTPGERESRWLVVTPADKSSETVIITGDHSLLDAVDDRVLLLTTDSLDAEHISIHRIVRT